MKPHPNQTMNDLFELKDLCKTLNINFDKIHARTNTVIEDEKLINLDLSRLSISNLPHDIFSTFNFLQALDLSHNKIQILPNFIFEKLDLIELKLRGNQLSINSEIFEPLSKLIELSITFDNNYAVDPDLFVNLKTLVILSVDTEQSIPESIFNELKSLRVLYLRVKNRLPKSVFSNLNLRTLGISHQYNLTKELFKPLENLIELFLNENHFHQLPSQIFDELINLKILDLSQNKLRSLEKDIFNQLTKLEELDLSNNSLSKLDETIFDNLSNLLQLNIQNNHIETFTLNNTIINIGNY